PCKRGRPSEPAVGLVALKSLSQALLQIEARRTIVRLLQRLARADERRRRQLIVLLAIELVLEAEDLGERRAGDGRAVERGARHDEHAHAAIHDARKG